MASLDSYRKKRKTTTSRSLDDYRTKERRIVDKRAMDFGVKEALATRPAIKTQPEPAKWYRPFDVMSENVGKNVELVKDIGTTLGKGYSQSNRALVNFFKEQQENLGLGTTPQQQQFFEQQPIKQQERIEKLQDTQIPGIVGQAIETVPLSATVALNPWAAPLLMGAVGYGGKAEELEQMGATQKEQQIGGAISGTLEAGLNYVTAGALNRILKGSGTFKDFAKGLLGEVAEEGLQAALDPEVTGLVLDDYEKPEWKDRINDIVNAAGVATITTLMTFGFGVANQLATPSAVGTINQALNNPTKENLQKAVTEIEKVAPNEPLIQQAKSELGLQQVVQQARIGEEGPMKPPANIQGIFDKVGEKDVVKDAEGKVETQDQMIDAYQGQSNHVKTAFVEGKPVGTLEYTLFNGEPSISMIEVNPEYRRQGIATQLITELQNENPKYTVKWGTTTEDGTALQEAITREVPIKEVQDKKNRIQELKSKQQEIEEIGFENLSEAEGDKWNDYEDEINILEREILGKPESERLLTPSDTTQTKPTLTEDTGLTQPSLEVQPSDKIKSIFEKATMAEDTGIADETGVSLQVKPEELGIAKTVAQDIKALKEVATDVFEQSELSKYDKLIDEVFEKGMSRVSKNTINRLIAAEQSIKPLKEKHKADLKALRDKQKAKDVARKESGIRSQLLKVSKEMQKGRLNPEFQKVADELFGNIDTMAKSISSKKQIQLDETLANIQQLEEQGLEVDQELKDAVARLNRKQINDMAIEEVQDLIDMAKHLKKLNTEKNQAKTLSKNQTVKEIVEGMKSDLFIKPSKKAKKAIEAGDFVENKSAIKKFVGAFVGKPADTIGTLMYELGRGNKDSAAYNLAEKVGEQQDVELSSRRELNDILNGYMDDYKKLASSKEWNQEQDGFTSGERVYLKLALDDTNVLKSLKEKGYRKQNQRKAQKISKAEIEAIQLNEQEQQAYDAAREFFDRTYELLNEAHIELKGYELPKIKSGKYLPKKVSDMSLADELGAMQRPGGLSDTGVTKKRTGSLNEIILPDILDIYDRQLNVASKYNAYVNLVKDVSKVFSNPSLRESLRTEYGVEKNGKSIVENYMNDLFQDLQGTKQAKRTDLERALRNIRTKAAPAILAFRATTPLIQTASYPMAVTEISPQNLAKGLAQKGKFAEAAKYNERANARAEGNIDRELADANVRKVVEFGLKPIKFMDKATIGKLWNATKLQVKQETGKTGKDLLEATSKRFNRVLDTQPNYTTADRSMTMRSQSEIDKALTMFSSAKSSVLNELKRGYIDAKYKGDFGQLTKASAGLTTSVFMMATISNLFKKASGDEEEFIESLIKRASGALPLMDTLSSLYNGYDISNIGIDTIEDVADAFTSSVNLISDAIKGEEIKEEKLVKTFWKLTDSLSLMFGVPVETIRNDIQLLINQLPDKDLLMNFKRYTDPMTRTELYNNIEQNIDNPSVIDSLLKELARTGGTEKGLQQSMKNRDVSPGQLSKLLRKMR